ncbi:MAG: DUF3656 domain-containing U32 family peptidase [bacterium]
MNDRLELLAPAGDMDALRAAVQNGADAVYLGTGSFNARRHAGNFDGDGLKTAVDYCHARGVKVHVTLNTLVRQDELDALFDTIRQVNQSGADAVIVQDFGAARAIRAIAPELELHASTQMAAHNAQAADFLRKQGFDRVVLAREATFADMAACAATGIDVEVFVHGALCVACSGQCLMSSLVGGRSGNRGLCAQPCRLPWKLDDREGYLLSTKDLCAIDDLPRLREAGVKSLKIEGRLKRAEYVAVTVAAYRRALDALYDGKFFDTASEKDALRQMFNRGGFTRGYAPGMAEGELMFSQRPNHIGVPVGACRNPGEIALEREIEGADALVLRRGDVDTPVKLTGGAGERVKCPRTKKGDTLIRLVSEAQMREARESFDGEHRQNPVTMTATLKTGEPAKLMVSDGVHTVNVTGEILQPATGRPFDAERAKQQLQKTGGTPWRAAAIEIDADANVFVPASLLNALRRDALSALSEKTIAVRRENHTVSVPEINIMNEGKPLLCAQSHDPAILKTALECGADVAVYEPADLRALNVAELPERFALAVPDVLTAAALDSLNDWANANAERITETLLSNVGHFDLRWPGKLTGDYMLNAGNDLTVAQLQEWGMDAFTPSVELTSAQISRLHGRMNIVMWGRLSLMRLRHCPLRAARGMAGRHADCRNCDVSADRLEGRTLIDRKGAAFPLHRVAMPGGCVVQILNSVPLMPLKKLDRLPKASGWRLLLRPGEPVAAIVKIYRAALDGENFKALPEWQSIENMETTTGHFFRGVD